MANRNRRGRSGSAPPAGAQPPAMSLTISLPEIYDALCPSCREAFLALVEAKASHGMLRESLRQQLESPSHEAEGFNPQTQ